MNVPPDSTEMKLHFVTGKLAEPALRELLVSLSKNVGFEYTVDVLPITVAALMTVDWVIRHISVPESATRVLLPGYCLGEVDKLEIAVGVPVKRGPKDLRELPDFFGRPSTRQDDYGAYDVEILAEINHAPRIKLDELLRIAEQLSTAGADIIDVGCEPGGPWPGAGDCVHALRDAGHRVSIDSMNSSEIASAIDAGAELVLSVNSGNRTAAVDWGCEVVVIPDDPATLGGFEETMNWLDRHDVSYRLDPILEPIGFGFAKSLERYFEVRRQYPDAAMMMGIGNLSEMTDVDSAGINALLLGICQEIGIRSILTTQVINWARTSVRECDLARRLMYCAAKHRVTPKHIEPDLVVLRDAKLTPLEIKHIEQLSRQIRDHNFRLFAESEAIHVVSDQLHLHDSDPFQLFARLFELRKKYIDPSHAFYLGYEMAKAFTALTLGKQYRQDEALDWGYLTVAEKGHRG